MAESKDLHDSGKHLGIKEKLSIPYDVIIIAPYGNNTRLNLSKKNLNPNLGTDENLAQPDKTEKNRLSDRIFDLYDAKMGTISWPANKQDKIVNRH